MTEFSLSGFLLEPEETVDPAGLCGLWSEHVVEAVCRLDPAPWDLGLPPWVLAGKVRGAWGDVLKDSASPRALAGEPCPWRPPCGLDVFFRAQGRLAGGLEIPKPFVIRVTYVPDKKLVVIELALFGLAGEYAPAAVQSLAAALQHRLRWARGQRAGCRVEMLTLRQAGAVSPLEGEYKACLRFITPLSQRSGRESIVNPASLVTGLGGRLSGLARWHGVELAADFAAIKGIAQGLQWEAQERDAPRWFRQSQRQGARGIPMSGFLGDIRLRGDLLALAPLLALGQRCHAGGRTSLGMGRYRLHWR
jgi:hypothetical protein